MSEGVEIKNIVIPVAQGKQGIAGIIKSISIEMIDNDLPAQVINNGSESVAELLLKIPKVKEVEQVLIDDDMHMIINYTDGTMDNAGTLKGINEIKVENGHLIFTLSDETVIDTGYLYDDTYIQEKIEIFNRNAEEQTIIFNQHANEVKEDFSYEKNDYLKEIDFSQTLRNNTTGLNVGGIKIERTREKSKSIEELWLEDFLMYDNITQKLIRTAELDETTGIVTFTHLDGSKSSIDLPLEKLLKRGYYDDQTKDLVLVFNDDTETRIPAERLIDVYTGTEEKQIQILVSATNEISAIIKNGSIEEELLSADIRKKLNKDVYTKSEIDLKETALETKIENVEDKVQEIDSKTEANLDKVSTLEQEVFEKANIKSESNTMILEDTEEGLNIAVNEIESNKMEQETREGYNKFKNYSYNNDSVTDAGITVTLQENGKVLLNGTSTQDVWFELMYALKSRNFNAK